MSSRIAEPICFTTDDPLGESLGQTHAATIYPSQLARTHARIAHALEQASAPVGMEPRIFELARHWLAAGPVHAAPAWRAAVEAAAAARADFAHDEAVDLLSAAVEAQRLDPATTRDQHFDALLTLAEVASYAGKWPEVVAASVEAVGLASAADDSAGVARAAEGLTRHSVWLPQDHRVVADDLIDDLRHALAGAAVGGPGAGGGDSAVRVRLDLALATQLYYAPGHEAEALALVDQGCVMARRLGDPELVRWAAHTATLALWRTRFAHERAALAEEALTAARTLGDRDAEALALTTVAGIALELGDREGYERAAAEAGGLARRRSLGYLRLALGSVELSLAALRASPEVERLHAELLDMAREAMPINGELFAWGVDLMAGLWSPDIARPFVDQMLPIVRETADPMTIDPVCIGLVRLGRLDELRDLLATVELPPLTDHWSTSWDAAFRAEMASSLGSVELAQASAVVLRPTGRPCRPGSGA